MVWEVKCYQISLEHGDYVWLFFRKVVGNFLSAEGFSVKTLGMLEKLFKVDLWFTEEMGVKSFFFSDKMCKIVGDL